MPEDVGPHDSAPATPAPEPAPAAEHAPAAAPAPEPTPAPQAVAAPEAEPASGNGHVAEPVAAAAAEPAPAPVEAHAEGEEDGAVAEAPEEAAAAVEEAKPNNKHWYVVKVQSGREETIKEAIERRVRKEGLEEFYGQIVIPVEKFTEVRTDKNGKRVTKTKERKLYPGYLMVEVEYNDRILYLFRETSGVGDFVGGTLHRPPPPMSEREIQRMIGPQGGAQDQPVVPVKPKGLDVGDRVKVVDGAFSGMEGEVKQIHEAVGKLAVEVTIFGRPVKFDLEYYQVEPL